MSDGNGSAEETVTSQTTPGIVDTSEDKRPDSLNTGLDKTQEIKEEETEKAPDKPEEITEELTALIIQLREIHSKASPKVLEVNWEMGKAINDVYQKAYKKDEMGLISKKLGIEKGSLYKMRQFARRFKEDQCKQLIEGNNRYPLPWRAVVQNLTVLAVDFINVYNETSNVEEFCGRVTEFKPPRKTATSKPKKMNDKQLAQAEEFQRMNEKINHLESDIKAKEGQYEKLKNGFQTFEREVIKIVTDSPDIHESQKTRIIETIKEKTKEIYQPEKHITQEETVFSAISANPGIDRKTIAEIANLKISQITRPIGNLIKAGKIKRENGKYSPETSNPVLNTEPKEDPLSAPETAVKKTQEAEIGQDSGKPNGTEIENPTDSDSRTDSTQVRDAEPKSELAAEIAKPPESNANSKLEKEPGEEPSADFTSKNEASDGEYRGDPPDSNTPSGYGPKKDPTDAMQPAEINA